MFERSLCGRGVRPPQQGSWDHSSQAHAIRSAYRRYTRFLWPPGASGALCFLILAPGCKSTSVTEVRGKTSAGPEFRNRGNSTSEVRYTAQQGFDLKWDNGWTTGVTYRRRDVDEGSGDNENRVLFEVSYPLWKAPKKPDKTARQIEELEDEVRAMRERVAQWRVPTDAGTESCVVQATIGPPTKE